MDEVKVKLKIVTPLFLGGAEPESQPELRTPSIKGVLRFWYRAMEPDYRSKEPTIFGSVKPEPSQAQFFLRIGQKKNIRPEQWCMSKDRELSYLAYGPVLRESARPYIGPNGEFELIFTFKDSLPRDDRRSVLKALWCLTIFGGLGARSRRGFGSIQLENNLTYDELSLPATFAGEKAFGNYLSEDFLPIFRSVSSVSSFPDHTAFSAQTSVLITTPFNSWENCLCKIANLMLEYRKSLSSEDSRIIKEFLRGNGLTSVPQRAMFGLPHNYFFKNTKAKVEVIAEVEKEEEKKEEEITRRASPLFIHVHQLTSGKCVGVCTLFPSEFLPGEAKIVAKSDSKKGKVEFDLDFEVLKKFLKHLRDNIPGSILL
jgi:CRISPR-associated protein Cmr1